MASSQRVTGQDVVALARRFKHILPGGQFTRNVALLTSGTALAQALVVLVSPLLTRLYTPDNFGIAAVYASVLAIPAVVASLCYECAILLPEDDQSAANVLALSLVLVLGMSVLSELVVWLVGDRIVGALRAPDLEPYLWLLPLSLLGAGSYHVFNEWAVRKKAFRQIAQTKLSQGIGMATTQLGLGLLGVGPIGLIAGDLVGRMSGISRLVKVAWREDRLVLRQVTRQGIRLVASRYRRFPLLSSGATMLNSIGLQLPLLLLAIFYGPLVVGWLKLGERVLSIPLSLIGTSISQVYVGKSARVLHTDPQQLPGLFLKVVGGMLLIAFPYVALLALLGPLLFPVIFGSEWEQAGVYVQLLAPMFLLQSTANPTGGILDVLERQDLHLFREILRMVVMSGALLLAGVLQVRPVVGIGMFSAAGSVVYIVYLGISFYAVKVAARKAAG